MYEDDIIQGVSGEVDATAALAVLRSLAAFLDYDENGAITSIAAALTPAAEEASEAVEEAVEAPAA